MKKNGPWGVTGSKLVYQNSWISVREDQVIRPNGKEGIYGVVSTSGGACALALDDDGMVYLVKQFRYAIETESVEAAAGGVEEDELPLVTAQRELLEEAGITADEWIQLGVINPCTPIISAPMALFLCRKLHYTTSSPDDTEVISVVKYDLPEAVGMVLDNTITHGPTCQLILQAAIYLGIPLGEFALSNQDNGHYPVITNAEQVK